MYSRWIREFISTVNGASSRDFCRKQRDNWVLEGERTDFARLRFIDQS
jgi:hypothetical protein